MFFRNSEKNRQHQLLIVCNILLVVLLLVTGGFAYTKRAALQEIHRVLGQDWQTLEAEQKTLETVEKNFEAEQKNSDALLEWLITSERPEYQSLSDLEKVRHIRDWLLQRLPVAPSDFYDLPALQVLVKNLRHERGVWCGGSAYLFAHVLNRLGFAAVDINFGISEGPATHVMTAVRIQHGKNSLLILLDAYSGLEIFDQNGCPADIKTLTCALRDGSEDFFYKNQQIFVKKIKKIIIVDDISKVEMWKIRTGNNIQLGKNLVDIHVVQRIILEAIEEAIEKYGYKKSLLSYLLLPIGVGVENASLHKELVDFYQAALGVSF